MREKTAKGMSFLSLDFVSNSPSDAVCTGDRNQWLCCQTLKSFQLRMKFSPRPLAESALSGQWLTLATLEVHFNYHQTLSSTGSDIVCQLGCNCLLVEKEEFLVNITLFSLISHEFNLPAMPVRCWKTLLTKNTVTLCSNRGVSHVHAGETEWVVIVCTVLEDWISVTYVLTRMAILTLK